MKKILCYGDSNTFGLTPGIDDRYSEDERWSGVLKTFLQNEYEVIEDGLNDRNGFVQNLKGSEFCALENLPVCLSKNPDLNIVVLAVGTNDLQFAYEFGEKILKSGLLNLIDIVKKHTPFAKIIIIPPVKIDVKATLGTFGYQFNDLSVSRSDNMFDLYKKFADEANCGYFDFNTIARPSDIDGLHYLPEGHKLIAQNLAEYIKSFDN